MRQSQDLLHDLQDALVNRHIREGFQLLDSNLRLLKRLTQEDPAAASLLLCLAQWVDLGYDGSTLLAELLSQFERLDVAEMKVADYLKLQLTLAFRALASEDASGAVVILDFVLRTTPSVLEPWLIAVAHFWKARAHRKHGEYELAMLHITKARELAQQIHAPKLVAVIKIHEAWLLFQRDLRKDAFRLLEEAEEELKPTEHALSLGNIESARGRFVRRTGDYLGALKHFERAIAIYSKRFPNHPNLARALVNAAYVKRLIALDLRPDSADGKATGARHTRYLRICQEALVMLERAQAIYDQHHNAGGTGSVMVNAGHLHLESGDIDRAAAEAERAYASGEEKSDSILMARARILQSYIESARAEEQLGDLSDVASHANLAVRHADDAVALARQTQNKRLLAGAYIARGAVASGDAFHDWETARQYASLAGELINSDDRDHLSKQLSLLKSHILRSVGVDETLRLWSDGYTGNKSFLQITEEFAEIVIPKVWLREDKKISKVAEKLSMSPKKVRRILRKVQILG